VWGGGVSWPAGGAAGWRPAPPGWQRVGTGGVEGGAAGVAEGWGVPRAACVGCCRPILKLEVCRSPAASWATVEGSWPAALTQQFFLREGA